MQLANRRKFLQQVGVSAAGAAAWAARTPHSRAAGANERVRVAIFGTGNQGSGHISSLGSLKGADVAYICDIDEKRLGDQRKNAPNAQAITDLRRALDDKSIDAVSIALPDHWHVPAALLAMDAGKHVYVEKPCSHNFREGQLLVAAAKKTGLTIVHGTQSRSGPAVQEAIAMLREGVIGDVLIARAWNCQRRDNIGHMQPSEPPAGVDYDTWVGPAEWMPFQENRFHYTWHWWHNFGTGDIGNDGAHEFDIALWGLGVETHPTKISAVGGKFYFDDDQEWPDTAQIALEYADTNLGEGKPGSRRMLIFEQRLWSTNYPNGVDTGVEFTGTKGKMFVSKRGKFEVRGERNVPIDRKLSDVPKGSVVNNHQNFLDALRGMGKANTNAEIAHRTAAAAHLGNIAIRVGRSLSFDPASETIVGDAEATKLLSRKYREGGHWSVPRGV
jgi:predicted dehydrogenase